VDESPSSPANAEAKSQRGHDAVSLSSSSLPIHCHKKGKFQLNGVELCGRALRLPIKTTFNDGVARGGRGVGE